MSNNPNISISGSPPPPRQPEVDSETWICLLYTSRARERVAGGNRTSYYAEPECPGHAQRSVHPLTECTP